MVELPHKVPLSKGLVPSLPAGYLRIPIKNVHCYLKGMAPKQARAIYKYPNTVCNARSM